MSVTETRKDISRGQALTWQCSPFSELAAFELYEAIGLRQSVFVVEQMCAYQDIDGRDPDAWHLLGWLDGSGSRALGGYARLFGPGVRYAEGCIGRVVIAPELRGRGYGRSLMSEAMCRMELIFSKAPIRLGAQMYLEKFYASFGFRAVSEAYEEDGIMHIDMLYTAE